VSCSSGKVQSECRFSNLPTHPNDSTIPSFTGPLFIHTNAVVSIPLGKAQCTPNPSLPVSNAVYVPPYLQPFSLIPSHDGKERGQHRENKASLSYFLAKR